MKVSNSAEQGFVIKLSLRITTYLVLVGLLHLPLKSQHKKDSLWAIWKDTTNLDTVRLNALDKSCETYYSVMPDTIIAYTHLTYNLSKSINHKRGMIQALMFRAATYIEKDDLEKALYYYRKALLLNREIQYENGVSKCFLSMGAIYHQLADDKTAINYYYEALKGFTKNTETRKALVASNKECTGVVLNNLAGIYHETGQADSALVLIKKAIAIYTELFNEAQTIKIKTFASHAELNIKRRLVKSLNTMGLIYYTSNHTNEAIACFQKAITLCTDSNLRRELATSYSDLAQAYLEKKKYSLAKDVAIKGLKISQELKDSLSIALTLNVLSHIVYNMGDLNKAIELSNASFNILKKEDKTKIMVNQAVTMAMWYSEKKDLKKAGEMYDFYFKNQAVTNIDAVKEELFRSHIKYDSEKKQMLAKAELEKDLNNIRFESEQKDFRKNIWLITITFILILSLISAWFIYKNFKQKTVIATQKSNILKQQLLVLQMNPHFIFNSLNAIQNFIFKKDSYSAGIYLKKFAELIRMILDFSRKDLISLEDEHTFLQSYLELQKLRFNNKFSYEIKIDSKLEKDMVMIPPMLAQPFIENAIEHGIFYKNGEGFLSIKISLLKNTLLFEIEDNGIGLGESLKLKSESVKKHQSLAIQITKERIETMNARNKTDFKIEIRDKKLLEKEASGVYVQFATPYLTL